MKNGRMQAKDLADADVLAAVRSSSTLWDIPAAFPSAPPKVVLAKLASLVRRGVLDGCACGCRGDFIPKEGS